MFMTIIHHGLFDAFHLFDIFWAHAIREALLFGRAGFFGGVGTERSLKLFVMNAAMKSMVMTSGRLELYSHMQCCEMEKLTFWASGIILP
jgi:hypothetical protein